LRCNYHPGRQSFNNPLKFRQHHHILLVLQGKLEARVDGVLYHLREGDVFWTRPGVWRSFETPDKSGLFTSYRLHFSLGTGSDRYYFSDFPILKHQAWQLQTLMKMMAESHETQTASDLKSIFEKSLLSSICSGLLELPERSTKTRVLTWKQREKLETYADHHIEKGIQPSDLAKTLRYSPDYFRRIFRNSYGTTPQTWLKERRLRRVAQILEDTVLSVKEIASELGYRDANLLARQFRQFYQCSPTEYRQI